MQPPSPQQGAVSQQGAGVTFATQTNILLGQTPPGWRGESEGTSGGARRVTWEEWEGRGESCIPWGISSSHCHPNSRFSRSIPMTHAFISPVPQQGCLPQAKLRVRGI